MKKEYMAQYKHKGIDPDSWRNAVWYAKGTRVVSTREEAQECLDKVLKQFNRGERVETDRIGEIGISTCIDSKTADDLSIVSTRIICREVTEWEVCKA